MIFSHVLYQLSYPATRAWLGPAAWHRGARMTEAGATGLEPATSDVTGRRSNQLNYTPANGMGDYRTSSASCKPRRQCT
jgi:hypothetical protein